MYSTSLDRWRNIAGDCRRRSADCARGQARDCGLITIPGLGLRRHLLSRRFLSGSFDQPAFNRVMTRESCSYPRVVSVAVPRVNRRPFSAEANPASSTTECEAYPRARTGGHHSRQIHDRSPLGLWRRPVRSVHHQVLHLSTETGPDAAFESLRSSFLHNLRNPHSRRLKTTTGLSP